jgi:hypothetical protein
MRKIVILGTLITLFGAGALAQAKDFTATEQKISSEASQPAAPAVRGEEDLRDHRSASSTERRESRDSGRKHHDEARERRDEKEKHGLRH